MHSPAMNLLMSGLLYDVQQGLQNPFSISALAANPTLHFKHVNLLNRSDTEPVQTFRFLSLEELRVQAGNTDQLPAASRS